MQGRSTLKTKQLWTATTARSPSRPTATAPTRSFSTAAGGVLRVAISGTNQYSVSDAPEACPFTARPRAALASAATGRTTRRPSRATSRSRSRPMASHSTARPSPPGHTRSRHRRPHSGRQWAEHVAELRRVGLHHRNRCHGRPRARDGKHRRRRQPARPDERGHADGLHRDHQRFGERQQHRCGHAQRQRGECATVSASPATLTTDQNTPVTFQTNVQTSLADTYTLTANAPPGWTVTIDTNGKVTATPAPGLQGGTFPIQIIAQSTTNPDLVAQSVVNVTITPTQPGITLAVQPDTLFTVPFQGAQLPTAFRAVIQNLGPGRRHLQPDILEHPQPASRS